MGEKISSVEIEVLAAKLAKFKEEINRLKKFSAITGVTLYYTGYASSSLDGELKENTRRQVFLAQRAVVLGIIESLAEADVEVDELRDQLGAVNAGYDKANKEDQS